MRAGWQWEGDLTIRDVTRPILLEAEFTGLSQDPYGRPRARVLGHGRDRPGRVPSQLEPGPGGGGIAWSRRRYRSISDALTTLKTE